MTRSLSNLVRAFASLAFAMGMIGGAHSQTIKAGSLVIESPWTRETPGGSKIGGGYFAIKNNGSESDRLVGGSFPSAGHLEIHEMKMEGDVMRMRALTDGLEIKPGETVQLKPGGYHLMFMDLKKPFKQGETVKGELRFEKAGAVQVEFKVEAVGATGSTPGKHVH
jgi:periplasmic copper chaperone A